MKEELNSQVNFVGGSNMKSALQSSGFFFFNVLKLNPSLLGQRFKIKPPPFGQGVQPKAWGAAARGRLREPGMFSREKRRLRRDLSSPCSTIYGVAAKQVETPC